MPSDYTDPLIQDRTDIGFHNGDAAATAWIVANGWDVGGDPFVGAKYTDNTAPLATVYKRWDGVAWVVVGSGGGSAEKVYEWSGETMMLCTAADFSITTARRIIHPTKNHEELMEFDASADWASYLGKILIPPGMVSVKVRAEGYSAAAPGVGKYVSWAFWRKEYADGAPMPAAWSFNADIMKTLLTNDTDLVVDEQTFNLATLGWALDTQIPICILRDVSTANNSPNSFYMNYLRFTFTP